MRNSPVIRNRPRRCSDVLLALVAAASLLSVPARAQTDGVGDWAHWRGPDMNGTSSEKNLPEKWSPKGENLLWRKPEYATRSTPVVMDGRVYIVCRAFPETTREGEKTVCLDAVTGELIWESIHNVYLSDSPAERVGWASVVGDPVSKRVYVLGIGCQFQCLDAATGATVWEHSLSEEYGMLSTYGGRTNFPVVFEDLVIISGVMTGWGETAVPAHRFIAFDSSSGQAVWFRSTKPRPEDTTYSTPVFATLNGQTAMVLGAGDGAVYAFQPRTGKTIWKYQASTRGINTTPLVDQGIVYCGHGEQNQTDTTVLGAIFAFDGNTEGEIAEDQLKWKVTKRTVSRSAPIKVGERVYFVDDGGTLIIVEAETGKLVGTKKLGRTMFGSPVAGDGKIYAADGSGRVSILKPSEKGVDVVSEARLAQGEEVYGSPVISQGRIYLPSGKALYCIGSSEKAPGATKTPTKPAAKAPVTDKAIAQLVVYPCEMVLKPGQKMPLQVRGYNRAGEFVGSVPQAQVTVEGGGKVGKDLTLTAPAGLAALIITAKLGDAATTARARVIPALPWKFDFDDGKVPPVWIGADYRHKPVPVGDDKVLVKISTIPKGTRSQAWMGWTDLHDYTIQADFRATEKNGKLPDLGLINQRYTLDLQGSQKLQIRSWTSRLELRFARTMDFSWKPGVWMTMKFRSENRDGQAVLSGKVWPRGETEPTAWQIEAADQTPNLVGSPGLFGNATDAEFQIDNVQVSAN